MKPTRWAWIVWLAAAAAAAVGLRHHRIDNALGDWVPGKTALGGFRSYLVVGGPTRLLGAHDLPRRLRGVPSVQFCIDPVSVGAFGHLAGVTAEDFVLGRDGDYAGIFCFSKPDASDDQLVAGVRAALRETLGADAGRLAIGGPALFHVELNRASQARLPHIMCAILAVGGILLWCVTGRLRTSLAAVAAIVLSQAVLFGAIGWLRVPVDMALSMVPPMMMALGFSYAVHRATRHAVIGTLSLCLLTTALGIGTLAATHLVPIRRFAICGVAGVLLAWLAVVTLVPAPPPGRTRRRRRPNVGLKWCVAAVERHRAVVLIAAIAVSLASVAAAPFLRFETDPLKYFPKNADLVEDFNVLNRRLTGMLPFQVVMSGQEDATRLLSETPGLRKVIDVSSFVGGKDRVYWCLADNDALPGLVAAQARWQTWAKRRGVRVEWRGVAAQIDAAGALVGRVAVVSLPVMALVAMAVIGLLTRDVTLALLSAWVNLLPVAALVVVAAAARWPLGLPAIMIGAIAVGVAIDDTVHVTRCFHGGLSLRRTLVRCWRPCAGSTMVTAACMAMFALAPFGPTAQFGILFALASLFALAGDLLVLPAARGRRTLHERGRVQA